VFNRPDEIQELLESLVLVDGIDTAEIVIIEDGSTIPSKDIIERFASTLDITYFFKENSGPGDSRNYGMQRAKGNYFIVLDSDCILPKQYLSEVKKSLDKNFVDCYGGPDSSHDSFSNLQKAIDFSMTSFMTTGGIRGGKNSVNKFQPRSFNMGISKAAFLKSNGFGQIHPGEDPDLTIRLWKLGYQTKLIPEAYVYHKRRISFKKFYQQVHKFGMVRPILNTWHPKTRKLTYWFPSMFIVAFLVAIGCCLFKSYLLISLFVAYFSVVFIVSLMQKKSIMVSVLVIPAIIIQFFGYGYGFLKSTIAVSVLNLDPEERFPKLFFKK
jgi:glycosyltransferase involved in cell wall biosynthesis